jgi:hypothetical protein
MQLHLFYPLDNNRRRTIEEVFMTKSDNKQKGGREKKKPKQTKDKKPKTTTK